MVATWHTLDNVSLRPKLDLYWSHMPRQVATWLAMVLLVAASSTFHVSRLEIQRKLTVDGNQALKTMGWANLVSGVCGGYQRGSSLDHHTDGEDNVCLHVNNGSNLPLTYFNLVAMLKEKWTRIPRHRDVDDRWTVVPHSYNSDSCKILIESKVCINHLTFFLYCGSTSGKKSIDAVLYNRASEKKGQIPNTLCLKNRMMDRRRSVDVKAIF
ncbi:hypothetical protein PsorP6_000029 [Peronosclerospora sorghi]|uniref:Uncharacterized protein n=1 Tax=Peronosclerospora sorghi TaxID=230839 RepID=A0ACC0WSW5_9STRA|nr:hypothetical protein PsorP6_000029 [Peronosclerospora sorghi]